MTELDVSCAADRRRLDLQVTICRRRRHDGQHRVGVAAADLARLDPGAARPDDLVDRSFAFLLEREPRQSILRVVRPDGDRPLLPGVRGRRSAAALAESGAAHRPRIIAADVRALRRPGRRAVPARRAVAVHRAARAVRDRRLRLGRGLARRPTAGSTRTATSARSATTRRATTSARSRRRAALVHLRRPSKLSTLGIADTQPFDDPAGRFSFSHNGDFREIRTWRRPVPGARAGSTAGPTPRSARAGSRTPGTDEPPPAGAARDAPRDVRRPGEPRRSSTRRRRRAPTPATPRTRCSRSASGGSGSPRPASTRSIGRSSGSSRRARPSGSLVRVGGVDHAEPSRRRRSARRRHAQTGGSGGRSGRDDRAATDGQRRPTLDGRRQPCRSATSSGSRSTGSA